MTRYYRRSIDPRDQYRRWIDPRVRDLQLQDVIGYLDRRGWKRLPTDRKGFFAFQEPGRTEVDGHPVCQFVPDAEGCDNYGQLMFELLTGLAEFEGRQASEIIDDMVGQRTVPLQANGPPVEAPAQPTGR